jgi:sugar O-acyltransferase (sialic acid O-acetyltransferase NeuD family)
MISVIFGLGGQGREAMDILLAQDYSPRDLLFCESNPTATSIHGVEIVSLSDLLTMKSEVSWIHVALGSSIDRKMYVEKFKEETLALESIESRKSSVSSFAKFGMNAFIADFCFIGPDVEIGDGVLVNYMASISHDVKVGEFVTLGPGARVNGHVSVGDDVMIGSNAVIRNGKKLEPLLIGDSATIGAGAVVTKSVPAGATVVGNPARQIS